MELYYFCNLSYVVPWVTVLFAYYAIFWCIFPFSGIKLWKMISIAMCFYSFTYFSILKINIHHLNDVRKLEESSHTHTNTHTQHTRESYQKRHAWHSQEELKLSHRGKAKEVPLCTATVQSTRECHNPTNEKPLHSEFSASSNGFSLHYHPLKPI